jgi:hypothetical protein
MGYLGFCYVESKSFEFCSEVSEGVWAVIPGCPSVFWLINALEVFIKGEDMKNNWRTYRQGNTSYVV